MIKTFHHLFQIMNIIFLGTPDFSVGVLKAIYNSHHKILAVVTQPDKPVGRKKVLTAPPVKQYAQSVNLPVFQYDKIKDEGVQDLIELKPDLMITCAFGQILSQEILDIPRLGVINIHASLLPKYRGASPIHYAILNGEKQTGIIICLTSKQRHIKTAIWVSLSAKGSKIFPKSLTSLFLRAK